MSDKDLEKLLAESEQLLGMPARMSLRPEVVYLMAKEIDHAREFRFRVSVSETVDKILDEQEIAAGLPEILESKDTEPEPVKLRRAPREKHKTGLAPRAARPRAFWLRRRLG